MKVSYKVRSRVDTGGRRGTRSDLRPARPRRSACCRSCPAMPPTSAMHRSRPSRNIDRRLSRANILRVTGGVLMASPRWPRSSRRRGSPAAPARRRRAREALARDGAILREVGRELRPSSERGVTADWTPDVVARLLTALESSAAYALGCPRYRSAGAADGRGRPAGQVTAARRGPRCSEVTVPGWVTSSLIAQALGRMPDVGRQPPRPRNAAVARIARVARLTSTRNTGARRPPTRGR